MECIFSKYFILKKFCLCYICYIEIIILINITYSIKKYIEKLKKYTHVNKLGNY